MKKNKAFAKQMGLKIAHLRALAVFALFAALPFLWMLITTFKQNADLYNRANNPFIFNMAPTLTHLKTSFMKPCFSAGC